MFWNPTFTPALFLGVIGYVRPSYFRFACCKYVPTILSESLAQARVAGTLRAKMERKIWIIFESSLPAKGHYW